MSVDIVIPTVGGREASLQRLIDSIGDHTTEPFNLIIVRDEPTCGQAWIKGLELARQPYVWLSADDLEVVNDAWFGHCVALTDEGKLPSPVVYRPDGSLESCGGDMGSGGCLIGEEQPDGTPVDFTPSPFMSRKQAEQIRMIPTHYMTDVYASRRGRQLGYETVVCRAFELVHHHSMVKRRSSDPSEVEVMNKALAEHE